MRGLKRLMDGVRTCTDLNILNHAWRRVHDESDVAALNDDVREWNRLCDAEHEIAERIKAVRVGRF